MSNDTAWFKSWFDTEYYHILYQHRDDHEAQVFIRNLVDELGIPHRAHILDLACGRGRHARFLSELNYEVTGIDLSESSIDYAKKWAGPSLHFEKGDMRQPFGHSRFDYILNLFTSFGYFENRQENLRALEMMKKALKPGRSLVLDFMNVNKVRLGLVEEEVRQAEGIKFHIERTIRDGWVIKHIRFECGGRQHQYEEQVQLLTSHDFEDLFEQAGLQIQQLYGDFELHEFDPRQSERLILVAQET